MANVNNVNVWGLEESLISSGYPMATEPCEDMEKEVENITYWKENGLFEIMKVLDRNKGVSQYHRRIANDIVLEDDHAKIITRDNDGNVTGEFLIDCEDILKISECKFSNSGGYANCNRTGKSLHRIIMEVTCTEDVVDHVDRNTFDNRKKNLRITDNKGNCRNNNGVGVCFRKDRGKWRAYITVNRKQISLGMYETKEEALEVRRRAELEYFGEYCKSYEQTSRAEKFNLNEAIKHHKRLMTLGKAKTGSGHDCACKGIIVQFDLTLSQVAWQQLQRYHFIDFVSSMSKMHRLTKVDLGKQCNEFVDERVIDIVNYYIRSYEVHLKNGYKEKAKEEWLKAVYNTPCGLELTARMTTNYLQLKTIYTQRKAHKLPEWKVVCDWIETLPHFEELTGIKGKKNG